MSELSESLAKIAAIPLAGHMPPRMKLIYETILEAQRGPVGDIMPVQGPAAKLLALDLSIALDAEDARIKRLHANAEAMLALLEEMREAHDRSKTDEDGPGDHPPKIERALAKAERLIAKVKGHYGD